MGIFFAAMEGWKRKDTAMDRRTRHHMVLVSEWRRIFRRAALVLLTLACLSGIGVAGSVAADLPYGQVKAVLNGKIQINNQVFVLNPEVKVIDSSGSRRTLADIQPGVEIEFRVQKGRIDLIVWIVNGT